MAKYQPVPEDARNRQETAAREAAEELRREFERLKQKELFKTVSENIRYSLPFGHVGFEQPVRKPQPVPCPNGRHDWGDYKERGNWDIEKHPSMSSMDKIVYKNEFVSICTRCGAESVMELPT